MQRRLDHRGSAAEAASLIAREPDLLAEARRLLPAALIRLQPAGEPGVKAALAELLAVFPAGERGSVPGFWRAYIDDLGDLPAEAVRRAAAAYRRQPDAEFFPKPGPLLALARTEAEPLYREAYRLRLAAEDGPAEPRPRRPPADPERVAVLMADFRRRLDERAGRNPPLRRPSPPPPVQAATCDGGASGELRALLARQAERDRPACV